MMIRLGDYSSILYLFHLDIAASPETSFRLECFPFMDFGKFYWILYFISLLAFLLGGAFGDSMPVCD